MRSDVRFSIAIGEGSALDVVRFELTEGVSQSFRLELELSSAADAIDAGNDETIQIGHDRKETVGNDETLSIGQDRSETLGRDHFVEIGRSRQLTVGKDLWEDVSGLRTEKTASDRTVETGGNYEHKVAGRHDTEAGERITYRMRGGTTGERSLRISAPGGTVTRHASGITIEGLGIFFKGPGATRSKRRRQRAFSERLTARRHARPVVLPAASHALIASDTEVSG